MGVGGVCRSRDSVGRGLGPATERTSNFSSTVLFEENRKNQKGTNLLLLDFYFSNTTPTTVDGRDSGVTDFPSRTPRDTGRVAQGEPLVGVWDRSGGKREGVE